MSSPQRFEHSPAKKNPKVRFLSICSTRPVKFHLIFFLYLSLIIIIIVMGSPLTLLDLQAEAAKIGVTIKEDEAPAYLEMLRVGSEAFDRLISMPSYYLPVDTQTYPRTNIHLPTPSENVLGVAWSYTFSVGSATSPIATRAGLLAGKTLCLKDNICVAGIPQVNGTDMVEPWIPEADATVVTRILQAGGEIIGTAFVKICLIPLLLIPPLLAPFTTLTRRTTPPGDRVLVLGPWWGV
jgi:hypothetical protein